MNMALSPAISRTLALFLLAALFAALYAIAVDPVLTARGAYDDAINRSVELIGRYNRVGATRERLEAQVAKLLRSSRSTSGYLKGKSSTLAAADLQNRVKQIVTKSGGTIKSSQVLPPREEHDLQRIAIRVQMTADIEALQKTLYAFEVGATHLFLDDVNIRTRRARRRRGKVVADSGSELTVRLDLYGFIRAEKS